MASIEDRRITGEADLSAAEPDDTANLLVPPNSTETPTLSVVMPTLNEEEGIVECIENVKTAIHELEVTAEIIVSDNSEDRTPDIAADLGATVVEPDQLGYGHAYKFGFQFARGEYIAIGDADTTYDFRELPKLAELVMDGDADIALGSRLAGEIEPGAMPKLHRYVGNPVLTRFLNVFYRAGVTDAHSGFRLFSRDALRQLDLRSSGMEFASEMIMDAAAKGLTIEEAPITYHEREGEATLDSFSDGWRHVKFMLVNAPGYLFSLPAVVIGTLGVLSMVLSLYNVSVTGVRFGPHLMVAGSLLFIGSFQVGSLAIFSSVASDPIRKPQDPLTTWIRRNFRLEHGATVGLLVCSAGGVLAAYLVWRWMTAGAPMIPGLRSAILALTAIVLGLQTVFSSFFFSTIAE